MAAGLEIAYQDGRPGERRGGRQEADGEQGCGGAAMGRAASAPVGLLRWAIHRQPPRASESVMVSEGWPSGLW